MQERAWQKAQGKPVGPTLLYFGCRNKSKDYIYQSELEEWESDGVLTLFTAFSRDQAEKRYVTHCLRETGAKVWELLEQGAHLYVCGDAKMMAKVKNCTDIKIQNDAFFFQDVRNIILEICAGNGNMDEKEAENYVKKLESQKRYSADVWS